jgi:hypothetical protein
MIWPFRKRAPAAPSPIEDDWQVGDLAECLNEDGWESAVTGPALHQILPVTRIAHGTLVNTNGRTAWGLHFARFPGIFYHSAQFRRIRPVHEPCEARFAEEIRRLGTVKKPVIAKDRHNVGW